MKETALYPTVKSSLLECGCAVDKIPGATYSQGLPDFICTWRGMSVHLEVKLKKPKNSWELTELQRSHLIRHAQAGAFAGVLTYQIPEKIWRLQSVELAPAVVVRNVAIPAQYGKLDLVVTGHKNLSKLLMHWLENSKKGGEWK